MVRRPEIPSSVTQRASSSSSLSFASPERQRAARQRMTKWRSTRAFGVAHDHLAVACEPDRLDGERRLLAHLAYRRFVQGLADFHGAARETCRGSAPGFARAAPPVPAVADDRRADREIGALRIGSAIGQVRYRFSSRSTAACGAAASPASASASPLITAPARAISGLSEATVVCARLLRGRLGQTGAHGARGWLPAQPSWCRPACRDIAHRWIGGLVGGDGHFAGP